MNFKNWLIQEMPIKKFELIGKWGEKDPKYGYNKQDIGILTNPKGVAKIHQKWSNTEFDFDFYFVRSKLGYKQIEIGEQTPLQVQEKLGLDIEPHPDRITIIFTNNTGTQKIEMTAWMIAHRLGHATRRDAIFDKYLTDEIYIDFLKILRDVYGLKYISLSEKLKYDKELKALMYAVGTMKSARQRNLTTAYEFIYELIAQFIIEGKIRFNPLPQKLMLSKKMAWGRENNQYVSTILDPEKFEDANFMFQNLAEQYEYNIHSTFIGLVGKMYIM